MRDVGSSEALCVFLSDAYLKSPNCMYELMVAWQRSKDDPGLFRKRVKIWVMRESVSISTIEDRLTYTAHWKSESERIAPLIKEFAASGLSPTDLKLYRRIQEFASNVSDILSFVADTLSPQSMVEFKEWAAEFLPHVSAGLDGEELGDLFELTSSEIDAVLGSSQVLREFLTSSAPGLLESNSAGTHLATGVRAGAADVCDKLRMVKQHLRDFRGTREDWKSLELFVGGLIVLAVNSDWLRSQCDVRGVISYPGRLDTIPLGSGRSACLIPVLTAAIARSHARLAHVFGEPNGRYLTVDPPRVSRGVLTVDKAIELKLHFIDYILGANVEFDRADVTQVEEIFAMTQKVMKFAASEERDPYFATSAAYQKLETVLRDELRVDELLLLFPKGSGRTDEVIADPIFLFSYAYEIFQTIKQHL